MYVTKFILRSILPIVPLNFNKMFEVAMITRSRVIISVGVILCWWSAVSKAGLIPNLFASNAAQTNRWHLLPPLPLLNTLLVDIPKQVSIFLEKLIPRPIKNLLNYDPTPEWVPHPKDFHENNAEEGFVADESARYSYVDGQRGNDTESNRNVNEKGNLHGFGREIIRSITNQVSSISSGLDTDANFFSDIINLTGFKDKVKAIYPGTQWCGDGNIARTNKDLGFFHTTDKCCREHDNCPDFLEKDESKHGIVNKGLFTRSNCACDNKFYKCLKDAHDMVATQIGLAYFSVLGPQCFKEEYPIVDCRIRVGITGRCIDYDLNNNATRRLYQWFDNPEF